MATFVVSTGSKFLHTIQSSYLRRGHLVPQNMLCNGAFTLALERHFERNIALIIYIL